MHGPTERHGGVADIVTQHLVRYPTLEARDLYKLAHQACLGSEHAVVSSEQARDWLYAELADLKNGPDEPLVDPISLGGRIARVHLRPLARTGLDPEPLLVAFVRTATEHAGSSSELTTWLTGVLSSVATSSAAVAATAIRVLWAQQAGVGHPPIHHSRAYRKAYRPAYRVVDISHLPGSWRS